MARKALESVISEEQLLLHSPASPSKVGSDPGLAKPMFPFKGNLRSQSNAPGQRKELCRHSWMKQSNGSNSISFEMTEFQSLLLVLLNFTEIPNTLSYATE